MEPTLSAEANMCSLNSTAGVILSQDCPCENCPQICLIYPKTVECVHPEMETCPTYPNQTTTCDHYKPLLPSHSLRHIQVQIQPPKDKDQLNSTIPTESISDIFPIVSTELENLEIYGPKNTTPPPLNLHDEAFKNTSLQQVKIRHVDLRIQENTMPSSLIELELDSCQLKTLPLDFGDLKQLLSLKMPNNSFHAIPDSIYQMTHLDHLNIERNPIPLLSLSHEQYQFLLHLQELNITVAKPSPECSQPRQSLRLRDNLFACVLQTPGIIDPGNTSSRNSMSAAIIVMVALTVVAALLVVFVRRKRTRLHRPSITLSQAELLEELCSRNSMHTPNDIRQLLENDTILMKSKIELQNQSSDDGLSTDHSFASVGRRCRDRSVQDFAMSLDTAGDTPVAVIKYDLHAVSLPCAHNIINDVKHMATLAAHPNISKFIGIDWDICRGELNVATEYFAGGNLREHLEKHELSFKQRLERSMEIASALSFLHSRDPEIVYGDLQAVDIWITTELVCKLPLAHCCGGKLNTWKARASFGSSEVQWLAPEILAGDAPTSASDVYSFGMTLCEIFNPDIFPGWTPYHDIVQKYGPEASDVMIMNDAIEGSLLPVVITRVPESIQYLIRSCLDVDPILRPSMQQVLIALQDQQLVC